jgi:tetratricopeptide (TPR) repeat protein
METTSNAHGPNHWHLLRHGDKISGLVLIQEVYKRAATPSHIMELGVAYLWTEDYSLAAAHFNNAIRQFPRSMSSFYGMAGAAQWCIGEYPAAVDFWREGLNTEYVDAAGLGASLPLLLFVASILVPDVFPRTRAEGILVEKAKDQRAARWPGTLLRFVLDPNSPQDTLALVSTSKEFEKKHRDWVIRFYRHILKFDEGSLTPMQLKEVMQSLADTSQPSCSDDDYFLSLMWNEEFFIARHIAQSV